MGKQPLTPEVTDAIDRIARLPDGLRFLRMTPATCVSATLGARLDVVLEVQRALEAPTTAGAIEAAHADALERWRRNPDAPLPAPLPGAPQPCCTAELIARAEAQADGLDFLLDATLESVAIHFGVHPIVVEAAREVLARRGLVASTEDEPEPDRRDGRGASLSPVR
jgi:hypothetical protein